MTFKSRKSFYLWENWTLSVHGELPTARRIIIVQQSYRETYYLRTSRCPNENTLLSFSFLPLLHYRSQPIWWKILEIASCNLIGLLRNNFRTISNNFLSRESTKNSGYKESKFSRFTSQLYFTNFQTISGNSFSHESTRNSGYETRRRERLILKLFSDNFPFYRLVIQFGWKNSGNEKSKRGYRIFE